MLLFHFCPAHMADAIMRDGLSLGKLPVILDNGTLLYDGCQWLTEEPDPDRQSWATSEGIGYSRTACRISIWIPKRHLRHLWKATDLVPLLPPMSKTIISDWEGSEKWYAYLGIIPAKWIQKTEHMNIGEGSSNGSHEGDHDLAALGVAAGHRG